MSGNDLSKSHPNPNRALWLEKIIDFAFSLSQLAGPTNVNWVADHVIHGSLIESLSVSHAALEFPFAQRSVSLRH